ncbi:MAG: alkaline phosphatase family protein [Acidimicrobiales bacterium]
MRFRALSLGLTLVIGPWLTPLSISPVGALARISSQDPCGLTVTTPTYDHVVWILLENVGYSIVGSPSAPYLNSLADRCGLATNYLAISHPSLPNYIALTSGSTHGITDDDDPRAHLLSGPSIFSELDGNWRGLVQSMPGPCDHVTAGSYAARHNPAVYYVSLGAICRRDDILMSLPLNLSAKFTFITPNICDDMHSCPVNAGDRWLARIVPSIIASPQYQSRSTALFITFDENDREPTNQVPTYVIAPSVPRGARVGAALTHYSLLRTTETLLHLPLLGEARRANSMVGPFHL